MYWTVPGFADSIDRAGMDLSIAPGIVSRSNIRMAI